jgi:hypothetical protein
MKNNIEELINRMMKEKYQLEDHMKHGDIHNYIDDNAEDLHQLLAKAIKILQESEKESAAA